MLQSSILTIEYQYTNVLKRVFTKVVSLLRKQHVTGQCKKDNDNEQNNRHKGQRTFKHIWFLPTRKAQTKNQKSLNFCQRSTETK
jgi:hypothetical protein